MGSEEGTPPRTSGFARMDGPRRGLPPLRPLPGINTGDDFVGIIGLLRLVVELFLRSISGKGAPLPPPVLPLGLFLDKVSKIFFISGGIGTECTILTASQSAAWT